MDIIEDYEVEGYNARQVMLKHKAAHGSGSDLTFPDANEIEANMQDYPTGFKVDIYGDGSYTSPTIWWAALGGFGVWMPEWMSPNQAHSINGDHASSNEAEARQQPLVQPTGTEANTTKVNSCLGHSAAPCQCVAGDVSPLSIGTANRRPPYNSLPSDV